MALSWILVSINQLYKGHVGMLNMDWLLEEIKFC